MAVRTKKLRVAFYALEPMSSFDDQREFPLGRYPLAAVIAAIGKLDPASEEYRLRDDLWGGETLCLFHDDGPQPLLGAYYRDNLARALTEYKGQVSEIPLRDGEALVDASFAVLFPEDVVGLVRTSNNSPSFARIGRWLSCIGGFACGLVALPDANALEQIDRDPMKMKRFRVRARRDRLSVIEQFNPRVARVLRSAADVNVMTDEIGAEWRNTRRSDQASWAIQMRYEIQDLLGAFPEFKEAKVYMSGGRTVDLNRNFVQHAAVVSLVDTKRVGPFEAAQAIFDAYEQERHAIAESLHVVRSKHDEWTPPTGD
jgi:hypothetical protein